MKTQISDEYLLITTVTRSRGKQSHIIQFLLYIFQVSLSSLVKVPALQNMDVFLQRLWCLCSRNAVMKPLTKHQNDNTRYLC